MRLILGGGKVFVVRELHGRELREGVDQLLEWGELAAVDEGVGGGEEYEVLEGRVQVRFGAHLAQLLEVGVVHVRVHAEESFEDCAHNAVEILREALPWLLRENLLAKRSAAEGVSDLATK